MNGTVAARVPVTLVARFVTRPGHRDDVVPLLTAYATHVRRTSGCLLFEPTISVVTPSEFVVLEQYRDASAFRSHLEDPENRRFNAALLPHVVGPALLEMLDLISSHASNDATARGFVALRQQSTDG